MRTIRSMTDSFATPADLAARLSPAYAAPSDEAATIMLQKASELVDWATIGRAAFVMANDTFSNGNSTADAKVAVTQATCDQVEFWLETGEEHDVLGLQRNSSLQGGRVQVQKMPGSIGQRARRTLVTAGLMWAGAPSV